MGIMFLLYVVVPIITLIALIWACKKIFATDENNSLLLTLLTNQNKIMATLQELSAKVDELQTALDEEQEQIKTAIDTLTATVDQLRADLAGGGTEAERQAVIDKIDGVITDLKGTVEPTE